jgi:hypothetical protein
MSLFVNIKPVPFRLLDDLLAQMEANNDRLIARQGDKGGPTRPRPQRTVFNADASTYRRPEPAAHPRRGGVALGFVRGVVGAPAVASANGTAVASGRGLSLEGIPDPPLYGNLPVGDASGYYMTQWGFEVKNVWSFSHAQSSTIRSDGAQLLIFPATKDTFVCAYYRWAKRAKWAIGRSNLVMVDRNNALVSSPPLGWDGELTASGVPRLDTKTELTVTDEAEDEISGCFLVGPSFAREIALPGQVASYMEAMSPKASIDYKPMGYIDTATGQFVESVDWPGEVHPYYKHPDPATVPSEPEGDINRGTVFSAFPVTGYNPALLQRVALFNGLDAATAPPNYSIQCKVVGANSETPWLSPPPWELEWYKAKQIELDQGGTEVVIENRLGWNKTMNLPDVEAVGGIGAGSLGGVAVWNWNRNDYCRRLLVGLGFRLSDLTG